MSLRFFFKYFLKSLKETIEFLATKTFLAAHRKGETEIIRS